MVSSYSIKNSIAVFFDKFRKYINADDATKAQLAIYGKMLKINFNKMEEYERDLFTDILSRYSDLLKPVKGKGRGKKKK